MLGRHILLFLNNDRLSLQPSLHSIPTYLFTLKCETCANTHFFQITQDLMSELFPKSFTIS